MPPPAGETIPEENMPDKEYQPSQDGDNVEGEIAAASNAPAVTDQWVNTEDSKNYKINKNRVVWARPLAPL